MDKSYSYRAFRLAYTPTEKKQGGKYIYVLGPFRTMRAALWTERFGSLNPHFGSVSDAERLAKIWAEHKAIPRLPDREGLYVRG
jgi:hypothetical protein